MSAKCQIDQEVFIRGIHLSKIPVLNMRKPEMLFVYERLISNAQMKNNNKDQFKYECKKH